MKDEKFDPTQKQNIAIVLMKCKNCNYEIDMECDRKVYLAIHYMRIVYNIVRNIFSLYNASYSENEISGIRNEVFCKLFNNQCALLKKFNPKKGSFVNWLKVISNTTVLDYLRYRNLRIMEELDMEPPIDYLERYLEEKEEKRMLRTGIQQLNSKKIKDVMNLVNQDYSDSEISNKLDISVVTTRTRKYRGTKILKTQISKK